MRVICPDGSQYSNRVEGVCAWYDIQWLGGQEPSIRPYSDTTVDPPLISVRAQRVLPDAETLAECEYVGQP